jgi:hypothetical protein
MTEAWFIVGAISANRHLKTATNNVLQRVSLICFAKMNG